MHLRSTGCCRWSYLGGIHGRLAACRGSLYACQYMQCIAILNVHTLHRFEDPVLSSHSLLHHRCAIEIEVARATNDTAAAVSNISLVRQCVLDEVLEPIVALAVCPVIQDDRDVLVLPHVDELIGVVRIDGLAPLRDIGRVGYLSTVRSANLYVVEQASDLDGSIHTMADVCVAIAGFSSSPN